jgi:hypothetical protein
LPYKSGPLIDLPGIKGASLLKFPLLEWRECLDPLDFWEICELLLLFCTKFSSGRFLLELVYPGRDPDIELLCDFNFIRSLLFLLVSDPTEADIPLFFIWFGL